MDCFVVLLVVLALTACGWLLATQIELKKVKALQANFEAQYRASHLNYVKGIEENRALDHAFKSEAAKHRQALAAAEAELTRYRQQFLKDVQGLEEIDRFLRDAQLQQSQLGRDLAVRVLASPTGRVAFEWVVQGTRRCAPELVIRQRGYGDIIRGQSFDGRYVTYLPRGKPYTFEFVCHNGGYNTSETIVTVMVPTPEQFLRSVAAFVTAPPAPPAAGEAEQRHQRREKILGFLADALDLHKTFDDVTQTMASKQFSEEEQQILWGRIHAWLARESERE